MSDTIAKINKKLDQLGKYEPTPKEIIEECYATLNKKLNDGWSFDKLAKIISAEGCIITGTILKQHYNKIYNTNRKLERLSTKSKPGSDLIKSTEA